MCLLFERHSRVINTQRISSPSTLAGNGALAKQIEQINQTIARFDERIVELAIDANGVAGQIGWGLGATWWGVGEADGKSGFVWRSLQTEERRKMEGR